MYVAAVNQDKDIDGSDISYRTILDLWIHIRFMILFIVHVNHPFSNSPRTCLVQTAISSDNGGAIRRSDKESIVVKISLIATCGEKLYI